ncbi:ROK family transcriptional regulator [Nocardia tengchongensis]|uniref:ROK family transcriptional regulator n=1 Tax=Nocardia tengchongensis TaxID=2055889 RepID=UPI0036CCE37F
MTGRPMATPGVSAGDVLGLIRADAVATRSDIARQTGLSRTAVTLRVEQLLALGLATERAEGASTGGRPPSRLRFAPNAGVVLAASIGASRTQVAVCDLAGEVLAQTEFPVPIDSDASAALGAAADHLDRLLMDRPTTPVYGVGVGVPSPVDTASGHGLSPAALDETAISHLFRNRFNAPVRVDTDVNVLALAEHARRPEVNDLLLLKASTGLGVGIIAGGRLQRGAWGAAGEIGHIKVSGGAGRSCRCGDTDCLETVAAGWALLDRFTALGRTTSGLPALADLAAAGDPDALRLVRDAGRSIGEVMAAAVNLLNPAAIIVRGDLSRAFTPLAAGLREQIYRHSSALNTRALHIEPADTDAPTGIQACAAMILDEVLDPAAINARLAGTA